MPTTHCTICGISREESPVKFHRNQCIRCHNNRNDPGRAKHRNCSHSRYKRYKTENICVCCGKPAEDNRKKCRKCNDYYNEWARQRRRKMRLASIEHYGPNCAYCGEDFEPFLSIDHINDDGNTHRKTINASGGNMIHEWLAKNDYPPGFQVLCVGCNMAKHKLGVGELHRLLHEAGRLVIKTTMKTTNIT